MAEDFVRAELGLLIHLMTEAKRELKEGGIEEITPDVLFKLAFSSASEGRKREYFDRKEAEEKRSKSSRPSYGGQGQQEERGNYKSYKRY